MPLGASRSSVGNFKWHWMQGPGSEGTQCLLEAPPTLRWNAVAPWCQKWHQYHSPLCHVTLQRFSVNGPSLIPHPCIWVAYDLFWPIDYSISEGVQVLSPNPKRFCMFPPVAGDFLVPWPSPGDHASSRMRDNQSKITQPKAANPHTWVSLVRSAGLPRQAPAVPRCGS